MHHVVYLPHVNTTDPQHLAAAGLADHADGAQLTPIPGDKPVMKDHAGGLVCSWGSTPKLAELPSLTWLPAMPLDELPAGRYFVGVHAAHPPTPWNLLKPQPFPGEPVGMGDGNLWMIPHAALLPCDIIRDPSTGRIEQQPRPQFYQFWAKCAAWQQMFVAHQAGNPLPDIEEQVAFVEEALRLNYRLTPELISHLRLFNTGPAGTLRACLAACVNVTPTGGD